MRRERRRVVWNKYATEVYHNPADANHTPWVWYTQPKKKGEKPKRVVSERFWLRCGSGFGDPEIAEEGTVSRAEKLGMRRCLRCRWPGIEHVLVETAKPRPSASKHAYRAGYRVMEIPAGMVAGLHR